MSALGFGGESSSDEQEETVEQWRRSVQKRSKKQQQQQQPSVVDESIYQYDEHYDRLQDERKQLKRPKVEGPRFMKNLLIAKEQRKQDKDRVEDVRAARERELEGDEYKDKEVFVTDGYKQHKTLRQGEEAKAVRVLLSTRKPSGQAEESAKAAKAADTADTAETTEPDVKPAISKSRLLPPLDETVVLEYRQRYLQRCVK